MEFLRERRAALGGSLPARRQRWRRRWRCPTLKLFESQLGGTGEREVSTTMSFVRVLSALVRDKKLGRHVVPIVPDESRTFGMEGMFRQLGIFSQVGQLYTPEDAEQLMFYREDKKGQVLQEGINEAGAFSSWIAAATSYSNHAVPTIPFYIFYSMFGFQRIGDLAWAAGDSRARGFLLGGTAGRTTLNGEGLQHEDGHSHLLSATIPNCVSYDPTYGYEVAVIIREGLRRMLAEQEDVFYYLTLMNENYPHPAMPEGAEEGILRGMYLLSEGSGDEATARVQLIGSGTILREVEAAAALLRDDWGVAADVWSVTSFTELRRDGMEAERWNLLHPGSEPRRSFVEESLAGRDGPVIAATDYMRTFADGIRPWVAGPYRVLGTDGFGRSDWRRSLRDFFEVDRRHVALAALTQLAERGRGRRRRCRARRSSATRSTPSGRRRGRCERWLRSERSSYRTSGTSPTSRSSRCSSRPGDEVAPEDPLVTLESDKATMDVPAPVAGKVAELKVSVGDTVSEGSLLLTLSVDANGAQPSGQPAATPTAPATEAGAGQAHGIEDAVRPRRRATARRPPPLRPRPRRRHAGRAPVPPYASPAVRRLARELGVEPLGGPGLGSQGPDHQGGRRGGVQGARRRPRRGARGCGRGDRGPEPRRRGRRSTSRSSGRSSAAALTRIQKISGPNLARNWVMIPHVTHHDEADITELEAFRKRTNEEYAKQGVKMTMVALLLKASVAALKRFEQFNASLDGDDLVLKRYYHLGFAADTPGGLVVPVIRDVDQKGLIEIAGELAEMSGRAREGKLKGEEMRGGTFTISSLGGIGGTAFTPIVNAPEVAILGVTRSAMKPVWNGSEFVPRLMVPLSLSYDHRVIDGAAAARFVSYLVSVLTDMRRGLL